MESLTLPVIITGVVMFIALVGMIVCAKKQQTNPRAQPMAIVLLLVVIGCGGFMLVQTGVLGSGETETLIARELVYAKSQAVVLGRHLAEKYPGCKVLVIANQNYEKSRRQKKLIDGIKEGLGSGGELVAVDSLNIQMAPEGGGPPGAGPPPEMMMPLEEIMEAAHFDEVIEAHPDCNVIISLIGLPQDVGEMALWKIEDPEERAKIALLGGDIHAMRGAFQKVCTKSRCAGSCSSRCAANMLARPPTSRPPIAFGWPVMENGPMPTRPMRPVSRWQFMMLLTLSDRKSVV